MSFHTSLPGILASCTIIILSITVLATRPAFSDDMGVIQATKAAPFPDIIYQDGQNQPHHVKKELGKLTIVHFWATWCGPCAEELPELNKTQKQYANQGLKVISISEDGERKINAVKDFFIKNTITSLPSYLDIDTGGFREAKARGLPTSYFVDANGSTIAIAEGPLDWSSKENSAFLTAHLPSK